MRNEATSSGGGFRLGRALIVGLVGLLWAAAGCDPSPTETEPPTPPEVLAVSVGHTAASGLGVVVQATVTGATHAQVRFWSDSEPPDSTPTMTLETAEAVLPVLGLLPSTTYQVQLSVTGAGGTTESQALSIETRPLPPRLAELTITTTGEATHPFILVNGATMGTPGLVYAFDSKGRIRWFREFTEYPEDPNPAKETKQQPNGNFTTFIGESSGYEFHWGRYVEFRPDGSIVREYDAGPDLYTDGHDLLLTEPFGAAGATHHLFGYDHRVTDLTPVGGPPSVDLAGHYIRRISSSGSVEFEWNAWDWLELEDWIEPPDFARQRTPTDFDHPNSLEIDGEGNYIVSWRHLGEVTSIDGQTGAIRWRLGGRNNEFEFIGDPLGGFSAQHMARVLGNGNLLLFDNGLRHSPPESRAVEYALDPVAKTATMVWQYRPGPEFFSMFVSGAERHRSGNTLVGFGVPAQIAEVDQAGDVVFSAFLEWQGRPAVFYRAHAIPSLYGYARP